MAEAVRVLVADDQALLRGSFRLLVDSTPGMEAIGEASDGAMAVELARELKPHVVLMDLRMPVMDGVAATRQICSDDSMADVRVLALTMFDMDEYVYPALQAGASGFMLKDASPSDLVAGIRVIADGDGVLAPTVTRRLLAKFSPRGEVLQTFRPTPRLAGLTQREQEVLVLIANGLSNAEISGRLVIGLPTVKTHVSSLLAKLNARDRAQLVIVAYESGLTRPGVST
ncbi:response regulator [Streptomyces sp. NPDC088400]|jgi:DNA-binding NarL/FixJ family response regulator|uniref:response regulator n=1 Tax=Streptomyces sp. NPDC088400 TaxID=3365861 RepID=UPI00381DE077